MSEIRGVRGQSTADLDRWDRGTESRQGAKTPGGAAWNADYDKIPSGIHQYDQTVLERLESRIELYGRKNLK